MMAASGILVAVRRGDALAGLEKIGWAALRHAYGPAGDVPGLLRALVSESPAERRHALHELYGNIFHQGSRYEATAHAVPFLVRLALDPQTVQRDEIVRLLVALAIGYDEAYLPAGIDVAGWRAGIEQMRSVDPAQQLRELDAWVEAATEEADRRVRDMKRMIYDPGLALRSAVDELAAYDAVRAEVLRLRGLLGDDDPRVRAAAAYLVGWFPQEAPGSARALRGLLASETVPAVAASAIVSAGLLGDEDLMPQLREHLSGPEHLLRWGGRDRSGPAGRCRCRGGGCAGRGEPGAAATRRRAGGELSRRGPARLRRPDAGHARWPPAPIRPGRGPGRPVTNFGNRGLPHGCCGAAADLSQRCASSAPAI
jgi:hypothetical protein